MTYDPDARRDTPLALKLEQRISRDGPISVAEYMRACLQDPEHGYYRRMPAIGASGDFITAPEISQVFGELIGLWCAVVWRQMGSPGVVNLVELGPGRGTLMRDALRAGRVVPGFLPAVRVHLVETNAQLRTVQASTLAQYRPVWHGSVQELERVPTILLGNEFLDTCAVDQLELVTDGAFRRGVGLDEQGRLIFVRQADLRPAISAELFAARPDLKPGDILECQDLSVIVEIKRAIGEAPLAGLMLDYGHLTTMAGDSLQALRGQRPEHPLTSPGEADLSVQVDFEQVARQFKGEGDLVVDGPATQSEFLGSLGIVERASRLMAANPAKAAEIEMGVARLIAPNAMGSRFKAIGIRSAGLPPLPGFPPGPVPGP